MSKTAPQRVEWVDAAKGVGILCVIVGHVWWSGPIRNAIYAFHMPYFFLLSGYLVRPQPAAHLLVRQARALLVPFAAFSILLILTDWAVEGMRHGWPIFHSLGQGLSTILLHTERTRGPFTILWFVPCLFVTRQIWNGLALRWPRPEDPRWPLLLAILVGSGMWVTSLTRNAAFGVVAVPAALTMFWVGQLWQAHRLSRGLIIGLAGLAVAQWLWLPPVNMKIGDLGVPLLSLAGAAAISMLLCLLIQRLPNVVRTQFAWLGRASLVIMYVHVAIVHYCAPYLSRPLLVLVALAGSLLIYGIVRISRVGRMLFLGANS